MGRSPWLTTVSGVRKLVGEAQGMRRIYRHLPSSRRCKQCLIPFEGLFAVKFRMLGIKPARKNPNLCTM